jgi:hypothetical protein
MKLEIKGQGDNTPEFTTDKGSTLLMTPALSEDYWQYRVKLYKDQAVIGFPKFLVCIGIGFAIEDTDWNTNLPSSCSASQIANHIWCNHKYEEITIEQVIEAVKLIQKQIIKDKG